jgi:UDP-N-acetylmuramoyl-tripeptide--D-alanyl-D-alanine ligase
LPLTLASTRGDEAHVVLELGMSAPGEIAHLTGIARPEIGIVCAAAAAHLEFFESVDGIADAKCEMFEHLPAGATAVANADDERIFARAKRLVTGRLVTWGRHPEATVRIVAADPVTGADGKGLALSVRILCDHESVDFQLPAIGAHNAHNAAAALAACHAFGLPLAPAAASLVKHFRPAPHRLEVVAVTPQLTVIDDAYNANPSSMAAALETLGVLAAQGTTRPRLALVLGTMHELGPDAADLHRDIGRQAAGLDPELVIATGPLGAHYLEGLGTTRATTMHVADVAAAAPLLETFATPNDRTALMLLKGSRAERLERVIDGLRRGPPHPEGGA